MAPSCEWMTSLKVSTLKTFVLSINHALSSYIQVPIWIENIFDQLSPIRFLSARIQCSKDQSGIQLNFLRHWSFPSSFFLYFSNNLSIIKSLPFYSGGIWTSHLRWPSELPSLLTLPSLLGLSILLSYWIMLTNLWRGLGTMASFCRMVELIIGPIWK